jgi:predicted DNA-binding transcriptional regulator AlpA
MIYTDLKYVNPISSPSELPEIATAAEVQQALSLSRREFRRIMKEGRGPKRIILGTVIRYARKDVLAWIEENTHGGV